MANIGDIFDEIESPEDYAKAVRTKLVEILPHFSALTLAQEIEVLTERLALYEIALQRHAINVESIDFDELSRDAFDEMRGISTEWLSLLIGALVRKE